jgi:predicted ArsR family transcriptional regulator
VTDPTTPRHTTAQVAAMLGVTPNAIRQHVLRRRELGALVTPRLRLYSDRDVEALRGMVRGRVGRPRTTERQHGAADD